MCCRFAALLYLKITATQTHGSVWWRKFAYGNKRTTASLCSRYCFTSSGPQDPASSQFPDAKSFSEKKNSASTAAAKKNICASSQAVFQFGETHIFKLPAAEPPPVLLLAFTANIKKSPFSITQNKEQREKKLNDVDARVVKLQTDEKL